MLSRFVSSPSPALVTFLQALDCTLVSAPAPAPVLELADALLVWDDRKTLARACNACSSTATDPSTGSDFLRIHPFGIPTWRATPCSPRASWLALTSQRRALPKVLFLNAG